MLGEPLQLAAARFGFIVDQQAVDHRPGSERFVGGLANSLWQ